MIMMMMKRMMMRRRMHPDEEDEEGSSVGERIDSRLIDDCVHKVQPRLMMTLM